MEIVQHTDKVCDRLNELSGQKLATDLMYHRILQKLGIESATIDHETLSMIKATVKKMFLNMPPLYLNESILPMLKSLKSEGYGLNIGSNTGFIESGTIVETLKNLNIAQYFDFCIFSDEIGASKPSFGFFEKVFESVAIEKKEILHIGDNLKADYEGALKYGFKAMLINNNYYTINDIRRHLQENN